MGLATAHPLMARPTVQQAMAQPTAPPLMARPTVRPLTGRARTQLAMGRATTPPTTRQTSGLYTRGRTRPILLGSLAPINAVISLANALTGRVVMRWDKIGYANRNHQGNTSHMEGV